MKINLVQSEIQAALVEYINNQGIDLTGKDVSVTLTAGRGANGHSAQIEISTPETVEEGEKPEGPVENQQAIKFDFAEED